MPAAHAVHVLDPVLANLSTVDPAAHDLHALVEAAVYLPALHALQVVAPDAALTTFPLPQLSHADAALRPVSDENLPALQSVHPAAVSAKLYLPAAHVVQVVAALAPLVCDPA